MKKYYPVVFLHFLFLSNCIVATAQPDALKNKYDYNVKKRSTQEAMYLNTINIKAISDFKKQYKDIDSEHWVKSSTGQSIARFDLNGCTTKVFYDKYGHWEATIKGYMENLLPFSIRDRVKRTYYDFAIDYIDEVLTDRSKNIPTYIVHIRYKNQLKFIRVGDDDMDVWKAFEMP